MSKTGSGTREIELDFLRGIAILMVLDFHQVHHFLFYPFAALGFRHFGWAGVDVFFVLSGFLVGGLLMKEWKLRRRVDSRRFLVRRAFKIWPQYYLFLFISLITAHRTLHELRWNLLNLQNYLGGIAHTWSLAVEEHAYLLLVALLAFAARRGIRERRLALALIAAAVFVMVLRQILGAAGHPIFAPTHSRIDGILEGVVLAMIYHFRPALFAQMQRATWLWLLLLGLVLVFFRFRSASIAADAMSFNVANLLGVVLLMLLYRHRDRTRPWPYRVIAWIGFYSYGIYLWHVSVIALVLEHDHYSPLVFRNILDALASMLAAVLVGWAMTRVVELPALRLRDRLFPRKVDSAVGEPAEQEAADAAVQPAQTAYGRS